MENKYVAPDVVTYNSAIKAYGDGGQWGLAIDLLREMEGKGIAPGVSA